MAFGITDLATYVLGTIFIVLPPGSNSLRVLSVASQRGVRAGYLGGAHLAHQVRSRRRLAAGATGGGGAMFIGFGARLAHSTLN